MKITKQGVIAVNFLSVFYRSKNTALVSIDLKSKYAEVFSQAKTGDGFIEIGYCANADTLNKVEGFDVQEVTIVQLEEFKNWSVWSMDHGRYTTSIAIYKDEYRKR